MHSLAFPSCFQSWSYSPILATRAVTVIITVRREAAISRRKTARVMQNISPENRGRRECRVRAAPAVSCANCTRKCAHEHTGSAETLRHSPRNGFTAYAALSSATNSSCHRRQRIKGLSRPGWAKKTSASLTPATGARTTRFCRTLQRRSSARRSIAHGPFGPPGDAHARRRCRVHRIPALRM
jgi:hypothetical protein